MKRLSLSLSLVALIALLPLLAHGAATVGEFEPAGGTWRVYRGAGFSTYVCTAKSEAAAITCASADADARKTSARYQIRYPNRYVTVTYTLPAPDQPPPPPPPPTPSPPAAGVLFTDDFRTGDLSHTENGVRWLGRGTNAGVVSEPASPSGKALRLRYPAAPDGGDGWAEQRLVLPNLTDVYIQVTARIAGNYCQRNQSTGGNNNKAERFWNGNLSDGNDGYGNYYIKGGHSTVPAGNCDSSLITEWGRTGGGDEKVGRNSTASASGWITAEDRGRVVKFTFHARTDTQGPAGAKNAATGGNGALEAWKGDKQVASFTNLIWRSADGKNELFSRAYLWGWANTGFAEETIFHVYGVTISTTKPAGLQ